MFLLGRTSFSVTHTICSIHIRIRIIFKTHSMNEIPSGKQSWTRGKQLLVADQMPLHCCVSVLNGTLLRGVDLLSGNLVMKTTPKSSKAVCPDCWDI